MRIVSRKDALALGLKHYFTGKPCKYGHINIRYVACRGCKDCSREKTSKRRQANPEKVELQRTNWRNANRERCRETGRLWIKRNPAKNRFKVAKHRATKKLALPKWADFKKIKEVYKGNKFINEEI